MPTDEPTIAQLNDLTPMIASGNEREPIVLIDTTGSMSWESAEGSNVSRREVLREAMGAIVSALWDKDSQAAKEKAAGKNKGGLLAFTFAGGSAKELGDLTPENWQQIWDAIQWGGGTQIMPGWNLVIDAYLEEFENRSKLDRPALLAVVFTDGEAVDTNEFAQTLADAGPGVHVVVAILGYGEEHDKALAAYRKVAESNHRIRVVTFDSVTNPKTVSDAVLSIVD